MPYPVPGRVYHALVSLSGHAPDSPYVTVMGSRNGLNLDAPNGQCANVFSTAEAAHEWRESLPDDAFGRELEVMAVRWRGGCVFTRATREPTHH
ncbi:hypothetical protein [Prescottella subtropica]|uniref:hypothetical protein n=1 Tax=Prescottella subtropica TaxID=2545757 RepID=UPI0010F8D5F0|nr:hypothetical protein [Prescottella subtropica]